MKEENKRITKQELMKIYNNVDRTTIEVWIKNYGLPMIVINSKSKQIRENDLKKWEDSMIKNKKMNGVLER